MGPLGSEHDVAAGFPFITHRTEIARWAENASIQVGDVRKQLLPHRVRHHQIIRCRRCTISCRRWTIIVCHRHGLMSWTISCTSSCTTISCSISYSISCTIRCRILGIAVPWPLGSTTIGPDQPPHPDRLLAPRLCLGHRGDRPPLTPPTIALPPPLV